MNYTESSGLKNFLHISHRQLWHRRVLQWAITDGIVLTQQILKDYIIDGIPDYFMELPPKRN